MKELILSLSLLFVSQGIYALPNECKTIDSEYYQQYEALSKKDISEKTKVIMIGSSSIQYWKKAHYYFKTLEQDEVLNRGIGGTRVCHLIIYSKQLLRGVKQLPSLERIVIYSGDNDLGYGYTAKTIQGHYKYLVDLLRSNGVKTPIYIISTKPSPNRLSYLKEIKDIGRLLKANLNGYKQTYILDRFPFYFNQDGSIKSELYRQDGVHLKPRVYWDWSWHLEKMWTKLP